MRPRYSIAKFTMEIASVAGALLIIIAIITAIMQYNINNGRFVDYLLAGALVINGIAIIAAAQMGSAILDTAISSRELVDTMKAYINAESKREPLVGSGVSKSKGIRAER